MRASRLEECYGPAAVQSASRPPGRVASHLLLLSDYGNSGSVLVRTARCRDSDYVGLWVLSESATTDRGQRSQRPHGEHDHEEGS